MSKPPRAIGRPLDRASARERANQAAALSDSVRLRVLSALAAGSETEADVAASLGVEDDAIVDAISTLTRVGLVSAGDEGAYHLTADAWVRFGRLLVGAPPPAPRVPVALAEQDAVVERIVEDLSYRFSSVFSPETVGKYVRESHALLAERARIRQYLPSLTARFATERLTALATANGVVLRGTPEVLFVCVQNAGRSQMAAAILRHLAGDRVHVRTAGSAPASVVHQSVIDALDEIGVPIAAEFPKPLTDEVVQAADYVITMGCGDACPIYPGRRYMDWDFDDPEDADTHGIRRIRDAIGARVRDLVTDMKL